MSWNFPLIVKLSEVGNLEAGKKLKVCFRILITIGVTVSLVSSSKLFRKTVLLHLLYFLLTWCINFGDSFSVYLVQLMERTVLICICKDSISSPWLCFIGCWFRKRSCCSHWVIHLSWRFFCIFGAIDVMVSPDLHSQTLHLLILTVFHWLLV